MITLTDSPYAWLRLCAALALGTIGTVGMYSVSVVLRPIQIEFGVTRSEASLAYGLLMTGFAVGSVLMGRLADRFGVMVPVFISAVSLGLGYVTSGLAGSLWVFNLAHGLLIGFLGTSAAFAPLVADISLWFVRRRGIAVAICASGNFLAGAIWPPILQHLFDTAGWRRTFLWVGVFCAVSMALLALVLRRKAETVSATARPGKPLVEHRKPLGMSPNTLQLLLCVAGVGCCAAMAIPLVHIVAFCGDLGYTAARGAEMLALMLGFGIVSRLVFGAISDRIGGLRSLMLASTLQAIALTLFLPSTDLNVLYAVSIIFGLLFGGVVPPYALIVREYFSSREAGMRVSLTLGATFLGMAIGGWMSGAIFDFTGSYRAAFANGILWNFLNLGIVGFLLLRERLDKKELCKQRAY